MADSIGKKQAFYIAERLLACALEDLHSWPGRVVISPSRHVDCAWAAALLDRPVKVLAQGEGNLGERLNLLDRQLKDDGYAQTIYIGSDAPILGHNEYQEIIKALTVYDIALCPALDGGVTMMANRQPWPEMRALGWSTSSLANQLEQLCLAKELSVHKIEASYDLDNYQQISQLAEDLPQDSREARQNLLQQINQLQRAGG